MTSSTLTPAQTVRGLLSECSGQELTEIAEQARNLAAKKIRSEVSVGDRVRFQGRKSKTIVGEVIKINRKNVKVQVETVNGNPGHGRWNVPPTMLEIL